MSIPALILASTNLIRIFTTGPEFVRENPNDFHCNQPDVIHAAVEKFRSGAKDRMHAEGLSQLSMPRKSTKALEELAVSIPIELKVVQTTPSESAFALIECVATIEFAIPAHAMSAINRDERTKDATTRGYARLSEKGISWQNIRFGVEFDERGPAIIELSDEQIPQILLSSIAMAIADSGTILERRLAAVFTDFYIADRDLNLSWNALSPHQRLRMRRSQREWIAGKTRACGNFDGQSYDALPIGEKIDVVSCHAEMTEARLAHFDN